jgi:hypothetical protein
MPMYAMLCDSCGNEQDIYRSLAQIDHELPTCCGQAMRRKICAPMVIADIAPYQAMAVDVATGKPPVIGSRSAHRDFLKRNGYIEVGNEMPDISKRRQQGDFNVRQELREAVREVLPRHIA